MPPHGTNLPETAGGYIVRRASHPTVASDACLPRLLLVVQQVHFLIPTSGMRPNNDTPSFRSYRFTNPSPLKAQELHTTPRPVGGDEAADWAGPDGNQVRTMRWPVKYGTPDIANGDTRHTPTGFASLQEVQRQPGFIRPTVHFSRLVRHPRASPNTASRCPLRWDYPDTSVRVAPTGALYKKINDLCAGQPEISTGRRELHTALRVFARPRGSADDRLSQPASSCATFRRSEVGGQCRSRRRSRARSGRRQ